jgi:ribose transport system ATP-binding protein
MLSVESVSKSFGATKALKDVSFSAEAGKVYSIIGENGSGKSTLMRLIAGESSCDSGSISFGNEKVYLAHQELSLCSHLTVAENIFLGIPTGIFCSSSRLESKAESILNDMGFGQIRTSATVSQLPVAERQIVQIARAVARDSNIILLDEPTSSLNQEDKSKLYELIRTFKAKGKLVLFISHFLDEIRSVADQIVILRDGEKVAEGSISDYSDSEIVSHMVGRKVDDFFPHSVRIPGEVIMRIENLEDPSIDHFELRKGEIVGVAGLNGAGRTEFLRSIMGLREVQSGKIEVKSNLAPDTRSLWKRGVGFISEERKADGLAVGLSIAENIHLPAQRSFFTDPRHTASRSEPWIESLEIKCKNPYQKVRELSGGNQQKVAFARLLQAKCDVFLLDEPTRGIDIGAKSMLYSQLDTVASRGYAVLMTSSYLPELFGICDRIVVMSRGKMVSIHDADKTSPEQIMQECVA